jgi:thiol:disulfide interchange protein DsbA
VGLFSQHNPPGRYILDPAAQNAYFFWELIMTRSKSGLLALVAVLSSVVGSSLQAQVSPATTYQENIHYTVIENAPVTTGGTVTVVEAFSYMCPHCGTFEPYITNWLGRKPANAEFKRIPVVFGRDSWELYAKAYVTAEMMGVADKAHAALMDKIWKEKQVLKSMDELANFYAGFGVEASQFLATSSSFAVDAKMRKDQQYVQNAGVRGTPSLIVGHKYLVAGNDAVPNYDVMLDVVNFLITKDSAEQAAAAPADQAPESGAASGTATER